MSRMGAATIPIGQFRPTDCIVMVIDYDAEDLPMIASKAGACVMR